MTRLRVATYNVRHCRGIYGRVDVGRIARTVNRCGADVVALQELDRNVKRSARVDQPAELARLSALHVHFWPTLQYQGGDFGIAVATRLRVETSFHLLDNLGAAGRRHGTITVRVEGLTIVATHLSRRPRTSGAEIAHLGAIASEQPWPAVIAGDLNQGHCGLGPLRNLGFVPHERHPTFPSLLPVRQIDYVLAGPGARVQRSWTLRSLASDHLPLVAEVVFD
jgi:endonuclease/exonuclease/phosphatase family metal-dependent hydrolase